MAEDEAVSCGVYVFEKVERALGDAHESGAAEEDNIADRGVNLARAIARAIRADKKLSVSSEYEDTEKILVFQMIQMRSNADRSGRVARKRDRVERRRK